MTPAPSCQCAERVVSAVDPIPGEVPDRDRRHARPCRSRERERRDVAQDDRRTFGRQEGGLFVRASIERRVEPCRATRRLVLVDVQAVDLHDAGVRFDRPHLDVRRRRRSKQPERHGRADDEPRVRPPRGQLCQQLDAARGVAEAMAGNIEDDRHGFKGRVTVAKDRRSRLQRTRRSRCKGLAVRLRGPFERYARPLQASFAHHHRLCQTI